MNKFDTNDLMNCFKMSVDLEGIKKLEDYIKNLEEENFNLREGIYIEKMSFPSKGRNFKELMEMPTYQELQERIDKAIDYIDRHIRIDDEYPAYMEMLIEERDDLLKILNGGDVDE